MKEIPPAVVDISDKQNKNIEKRLSSAIKEIQQFQKKITIQKNKVKKKNDLLTKKDISAVQNKKTKKKIKTKNKKSNSLHLVPK